MIALHLIDYSTITEEVSLSVDYTGFWSALEDEDAGTTEVTLGDINQDGFVNVLDLVTIVNAIVEQGGITTTQAAIADVNQDGHINVLDVVKLVNSIVEDEDLGTIEV